MRTVLSVATCLWVATLWLVAQAPQQPVAGGQPAGIPPATIDYQNQIHTILAAKCLSCHSAERRSGGLSLAAYADVLEGGRSGGAIRPGDSAESHQYALGRAPSADERTIALNALADSTRPGRMSAEGLADLLWAVLMKPEFQLMF